MHSSTCLNHHTHQVRLLTRLTHIDCGVGIVDQNIQLSVLFGGNFIEQTLDVFVFAVIAHNGDALSAPRLDLKKESYFCQTPFYRPSWDSEMQVDVHSLVSRVFPFKWFQYKLLRMIQSGLFWGREAEFKKTNLWKGGSIAAIDRMNYDSPSKKRRLTSFAVSSNEPLVPLIVLPSNQEKF